jgi:hypothetical protein
VAAGPDDEHVVVPPTETRQLLRGLADHYPTPYHQVGRHTTEALLEAGSHDVLAVTVEYVRVHVTRRSGRGRAGGTDLPRMGRHRTPHVHDVKFCVAIPSFGGRLAQRAQARHRPVHTDVNPWTMLRRHHTFASFCRR